MAVKKFSAKKTKEEETDSIWGVISSIQLWIDLFVANINIECSSIRLDHSQQTKVVSGGSWISSGRLKCDQRDSDSIRNISIWGHKDTIAFWYRSSCVYNLLPLFYIDHLYVYLRICPRDQKHATDTEQWRRRFIEDARMGSSEHETRGEKEIIRGTRTRNRLSWFEKNLFCFFHLATDSRVDFHSTSSDQRPGTQLFCEICYSFPKERKRS